MYCRSGVGLVLALAVLTSPGSARAADAEDAATRSSARKVAMDGVAALQQGNAEVAVQKLEKAFQILRVPSVGLWLARALRKRGQLVEASEYYLEASRLTNVKSGEQAVQEQARKDALRELDELTPLIPTLLVTVEGAPAGEVTVTLDGKAIPAALLGEERPANPGTHDIQGQHGSRQAHEVTTLATGEKKNLVLRFGVGAPAAPSGASVAPTAGSAVVDAPIAATSSGGQTTLAYVALAAGGVGLAVGAVTGVMAIGKRNQLDDSPNCRDGKCLPAMQSDADALSTLRTVSSISLVAGGLLAGTGIVLLVAAPSKNKSELSGPRLAVKVSPAYLGLVGGF